MSTLTDYMTDSEEQLMQLAIETMEDCTGTIRGILQRVKERLEEELNDSR